MAVGGFPWAAMRSNSFHRKYSRPLVRILLVTLALRALVPVGFMPMVGADGGFTLALCPGTQQPAVAGENPHAHHGHHPAAELAGAAQADAHHSHGDGTGSDNAPSAGHQFPCLFAAAAAAAPAPDLLALALAVPHVFHVRATEAADVFLPAIIRAQSARAPPTLI